MVKIKIIQGNFRAKAFSNQKQIKRLNIGGARRTANSKLTFLHALFIPTAVVPLWANSGRIRLPLPKKLLCLPLKPNIPLLKAPSLPRTSPDDHNWVGPFIAKNFPEYIQHGGINNERGAQVIVHSHYSFHTLRFLRFSENLSFTVLVDLSVADFPARKDRFRVMGMLLNPKTQQRVSIIAFFNERHSVPSVSMLYDSAAALEREAGDLFGVTFSSHPDLRRILTDYGYFGHPLRKDFPLTGYQEFRYDETSSRLSTERLLLSQELRVFSFSTPGRT